MGSDKYVKPSSPPSNIPNGGIGNSERSISSAQLSKAKVADYRMTYVDLYGADGDLVSRMEIDRRLLDEAADKVCVFCELIGKNAGYQQWISLEPLNPVTPGHRIFIPAKHFEFPHEDPVLTSVLFSEAAKYGGRSSRDYNLIVNSGPHASQTVRHLHVHYVPRTVGDNLKLPWTDQEKI